MTRRAWPVSFTLLAMGFIGCSDPVPPSPRGNLVFTLAGCTTYSGAVGADLSADPNTRFTQLPATDGTRPGRRIEDGQDGSKISCTVDGGDTNRIEATITGTQSHPSAAFIERVGIKITDGWIQKTATGGSGEAQITIQTGGVSYRPVEGTTCTLSLESSRSENQFTVDAGRVYARFDCPQLTDPPTTGCRASGAFVLERCDEE